MGLQRCLQIVKNESGSYKEEGLTIAFASDDMKSVNQHFGTSRYFAIYIIFPHRVELLRVAQFNEEEYREHDNKLDAKVEMLKDCDAVYCVAVGSSAIRRLLAIGVQPVKVESNSSIKSNTESIQHELVEMKINTPWIVNSLSKKLRQDIDRFEEMELEGWQE